MDIEELNKTQIILLVLLVSFITSIATGIVTVTLLAQAPPAITQTINHVVERTVETVVPDPEGKTTVVKETTTVVKEDDLITGSISKNSGRLVRIHAGRATTTPVVAIGIIVAADGTTATDWLSIEKEGVYAADFPDGSGLLTLAREEPGVGLAILSPVLAKGEGARNYSAASLQSDSNLKLGQTTIALSGTERTQVQAGIITGFLEGGTFGEKKLAIPFVGTSIVSDLPGTPLVNIFGEVVGISTSVSRKAGSGVFVSANAIIEALKPAVAGTSTPAL